MQQLAFTLVAVAVAVAAAAVVVVVVAAAAVFQACGIRDSPGRLTQPF